MKLLLPILLSFAGLVCGQNITLYYGRPFIEKGTSRQLTGYVALSPNTVKWKVNGVIGGNDQIGTVTQAGLFKAPQQIPSPSTVTISVESTAYPAKSDSVQMAITQPQTYIWSVRPASFAAGAVSLSINGAGFLPGATITFNQQPMPTTYVSATELRVLTTVPTSMVGQVAVRAVNPSPGPTTSDRVNVTVTMPAAPPPAPAVTVGVSPASAAVNLGSAQQFSASVTGSTNSAVIWSATAGSISSGGLYTAPATLPISTLPSPATATVRATSVANPASFATATITLRAATQSLTITPATLQITAGATQQMSAILNGATVNVTWSASAGTISSSGLFTAPQNLPSPAVGSIVATLANPALSATAAVTFSAVPTPPASPTSLSDARFLEQAAFGPTPQELAVVGQAGHAAWIQQQFNLPETVLPVPTDNNIAAQQYLHRLVSAPDQLRQRVVVALSKVLVISTNKNNYPPEIIPYWQMLSRHAFGNYRALLGEITSSPQMGKYLDLANSVKPSGASGANENYPRELLQLFSIGLVPLSQDGTPQAGAAYTQQDVTQLSLALTGWTFPTAPGSTPREQNWEAFHAPMEAREASHDVRAKAFLNCQIPAGRSVAEETKLALDCVFDHPNTAPFISLRLIRDLVTSNPSPAYVQRVINVWLDNGAGVKGDLKAVIRAILLDSEARNDVAAANSGRLKDATYHIVSFIRGMNGSLAAQNGRAWEFTQMGMAPLGPPSVFGFYPLLYRIPATGLAGPEFQIYTPTEAALRGNMIHSLLSNPNNGDIRIDLAPFSALGGNVPALLEAVNQRLLYGRMTGAMKTALSAALNNQYDANQRVIAALYLTALSGQYAVQH